MKAELFKVPRAFSYEGNPTNWHRFKQQFDIYMKATGLINNDSENKVNIFLNIAGEEALEIYNNLLLSANEKKNFDAVIQAFDSYCLSKQNVIYKSFKFFTRVQQPSEVFNDFLNDLQVMADFCNFGDQKDRLIRDRIIAGIRNPELQEEFLKAPDLSLNEVVQKCRESEAGKVNIINLKNEIYVNEEEERNNNLEELLHEEDDVDSQFLAEDIYISNESVESDIPDETNNLNNSNEVLFDYNAVEEDNNTIEENPEEEVENIKITILENIEWSEPIQCTKVEENAVETSRPKRTGKKLERKKKAEAIQIKIAEVKKNLCNAIKEEVDSEQMGIWQKCTRSRIKSIVKKEAQEDSSFEIEQPVVRQRDPYIYDDETDYEENMDGGEHIDFQEFKTIQINPSDLYGVGTDSNIENINSIDPREEITISEYDFEKEAIELDTPKKKNQTSKKNSRKRSKKNEPRIIKVKRDNLPPLILKAVRKKTLLLGKMPYPCKKCDASFWTTVQLERHQLVHVLKRGPPPNEMMPKKVFKCDECGKQFKKICDLERHTRVHTGEKPSVCNICNKRFQQAYNLNKHLLIHTQEKSFECVICQKKFGRNDVLNRHVLTHSIDKPFHCSICSKSFIRNSQLNLHRKKHHSVKNGEEAVDESVAGKSTD